MAVLRGEPRGRDFSARGTVIENRFMVEVMTPEMTAKYVELMKPEGWAAWLGIELPERGCAAG